MILDFPEIFRFTGFLANKRKAKEKHALRTVYTHTYAKTHTQELRKRPPKKDDSEILK